MPEINPIQIIESFYPQDTPLRRALVAHCRQVRDKALEIWNAAPNRSDPQLVADGAMLHDIGIGRCHAPGILCEGTAPYIAHGVIGAQMLREYAAQHRIDLEPYARICERHTGSGLSAAEIFRQGLPVPVRDYFPETPEEKLVCLADKFFSKSGDRQEKSLDEIRRSLGKFGPESLARFNRLCDEFGVK